MEAERIVKKIQINMIKPNNYQPRRYFSQDALIELSRSIKEYGVLQPISVRRNGEKFYELIAGERRLRATQLAGLTEIPAIVVDIDDNDTAILAMIENLQREDLNYIEEAEGYESLIKEHGFTQEELAEKIGKKQSTIANKLRILKLSDNIKQKLVKENLTERHARALLKIENEEDQNKIISEIIEKGLNVKKTEELIEKEIKSSLINKESKKEKRKENEKKYKWAINPKIITNTIKQIMESNGINAEYEANDGKEYLEIIVKIPKV